MMALTRRQRYQLVTTIVLQIAIATTVAVVAVYFAELARRSRRSKQHVVHPGGIAGARKQLRSFLYGSSTQFLDLFRMDQRTFRRLMQWLREHTGLKDSRSLPAEAQVLMTLHILGHAATQRSTAHHFKVSQATVSVAVNNVLKRLVTLHTAFVCLPPADFLDPSIELDASASAFNGCIGCIDSTHIPAHISKADRHRWRNRESHYTQNVLAAVNFLGEFVYVLAGSEGSFDDQRILDKALSSRFVIADGRYYLGDGDYSPRKGIVVPFQSTQYHINEWHALERQPKSREELYNFRHCSHRIIVENVFERVKRQWAILRGGAPEYDIDTQVGIVYAATGLYNFILKTNKPASILPPEEEVLLREAKARADGTVRTHSSSEIRDLVADRLWASFAADPSSWSMPPTDAADSSSWSMPPTDASDDQTTLGKRDVSQAPTDLGNRPSKRVAVESSEVATVISQALSSAFSQLASGLTFSEGLSASPETTREAAENLITMFKDRLSTEQLATCLERVTNDRTANFWPILTPEVKEAFISEWLAEAGLSGLEL